MKRFVIKNITTQLSRFVVEKGPPSDPVAFVQRLAL